MLAMSRNGPRRVKEARPPSLAPVVLFTFILTGAATLLTLGHKDNYRDYEDHQDKEKETVGRRT